MSCRKFLSASPYHPTRLIEIAPLASAFDDELHLRNAGEHSPEVPYMTLSHCWGKSEFLKLTKTTSQRLQDGFSGADTLSKTFQDAITICRKLGVIYLWIDSLCIFQDSPEDWRCEAAQMGQVYENSLCNIAATWASDDEEGCFKDRDGFLVQRCTVKSDWDNHNNGTWEIIDQDLWDNEMNRAPLNRRGWVMQERWLSPRVLHYGRNQLLWECGELDACETYPGGLPELLKNHLSGFKLGPEAAASLGYTGQANATTSDTSSCYGGEVATTTSDTSSCYGSEVATPTSDTSSYYRGTWDSMLMQYSVTSLTKEEDKLIAISGIAKRMQGLLNDDYLAGLWRKDLPIQLLWTVACFEPANFMPLPRPRIYRAPSWSWASVDGKIESYHYQYENYEGILVTILDAGVTPVGADSTGQIKDGYIRLNGRIFPAELLQVQGLGWPVSHTLRVNSEDIVGFFDSDTEPQALGNSSIYFLPIWSITLPADPPVPLQAQPWFKGLILQPAAKGNGTYERIGAFTVTGEESYSALKQSQAYKNESLYEKANGETIVLI